VTRAAALERNLERRPVVLPDRQREPLRRDHPLEADPRLRLVCDRPEVPEAEARVDGLAIGRRGEIREEALELRLRDVHPERDGEVGRSHADGRLDGLQEVRRGAELTRLDPELARRRDDERQGAVEPVLDERARLGRGEPSDQQTADRDTWLMSFARRKRWLVVGGVCRQGAPSVREGGPASRAKSRIEQAQTAASGGRRIAPECSQGAGRSG
jgi:hypothetical protein